MSGAAAFQFSFALFTSLNFTLPATKDQEILNVNLFTFDQQPIGSVSKPNKKRIFFQNFSSNAIKSNLMEIMANGC